jgi:hypothetical protein
MRPSRRAKRGLQIPWFHALNGRRAYVFLACLGLAVLFVQLSHPALHPHEVINPDANTHITCPVSHTAGGLLLVLPLTGPLAALVLWLVIAPLPWLGHLDFEHRLAPRPPPTFSL